MNIVLDTTVLVKAFVKPRRTKKDEIYREQTRLHKIAASIVRDIEAGKDNMYIPSIALIEIASVVSRLTGSEVLGKEAAEFASRLATSILYDFELLNESVFIAAKTKVSGFDVVFLACARLTNSELITDDSRMHDAATRSGIHSKLLRNF